MRKLVVILIGVILMGCSPVFEAELSEIALLKTDLKEAQSRIESLDINRANEIKKTYFKLSGNVDKLYIPDSAASLDQYYGNMRNYYKGIKKAAGLFTNTGSILEEIAATQGQIEMLETDIKEGVITNKDSVSIFLEDERKFVQSHLQQVETYTSSYELYLQVHDSSIVYFNHILDSLKAIE